MVEYKSLRETSTSNLEREIKPYRKFIEIWKDVSWRLIWKDKGGNQDCLRSRLLILVGELRCPQKIVVNKKRRDRGSFGSCSAWEGCTWLSLGKQGFAWGTRRRWETIQINYKMNFIQNSCQRFALHFKSTFHWLLRVYSITQKMYISQELALLWITLQCHET